MKGTIQTAYELPAKRRRLLIVRAEGFASGWRGATRRLFDLAAGLESYGWEILLLAEQRPSTRSEEPQEQRFPGTVLRTPFVGAYPAWWGGSELGRRVTRLLWRVGGRRYYFKRLELGWASRLSEWSRSAPHLPKPSVIWAVSTGQLGSLISGRSLAASFVCPLVLEIQDPIRDPVSSGGPKPLHPSLEKEFVFCCAEASVIITTSQTYADYLQRMYPACRGKVRTIYLSYEENLTPTVQKSASGGIVFAHVGTLYGGSGRNARNLIKSIARCIDAHPSERIDVRLRLIGGDAGSAEARSLAETLGIGHMVETIAEVPHLQAVEEMGRADVLVLIKFAEASYHMQIPGKLFQYLGMGKPVLGIMPEGEASQILSRSGLGVVVANEDVEDLARSIYAYWRNRDQLNEIYRPDWNYIQTFSQRQMAGHMQSILESVLRTPKSNLG